MKLKDLIQQVESSMVKYSYEQKKKRVLEQLGEYFFSLYISGKITDIPPEVEELIQKLRYIENKLRQLDHE